MKASRFSKELIAVLKEQDAGAATVVVCLRHGISIHPTAPPRRGSKRAVVMTLL